MGAFNSLENAKALAEKQKAIVYDSNGNTVASYIATSQPTVYAEDGTFYFNTTVKIRTAPNLSSSTDTGLCYYSGESVIYHTVYLNKNGYNWIQYTRSNGTQGYCAIRDLSTNEKFGYAV